MANQATHGAAGALTTATVWLAHCKRAHRKTSLGEIAVVGLIGAGAGILADVLEPAAHPRHRAFFHSLAFAALVIYGVWRISQDPGCSNELKLFVQLVSAAYGSHLILDSRSPFGLPLA